MLQRHGNLLGVAQKRTGASSSFDERACARWLARAFVSYGGICD
jgi:hypothetical protein